MAKFPRWRRPHGNPRCFRARQPTAGTWSSPTPRRRARTSGRFEAGDARACDLAQSRAAMVEVLAQRAPHARIPESVEVRGDPGYGVVPVGLGGEEVRDVVRHRDETFDVHGVSPRYRSCRL